MRPGYLFLQFWPPNGSLRGGRRSHFFDLFLSLGPFWAPLGSKWCQGPHYDTILLPLWVRFDTNIPKNVTSSGKQSQTSIQKLRSVFENWRAFRPVFSLYLGWFCVQSTAHEGMEPQGGIGRPRSVFENWRAFRLVFHYILWLLWWLSWARWRVGRRQLDN